MPEKSISGWHYFQGCLHKGVHMDKRIKDIIEHHDEQPALEPQLSENTALQDAKVKDCPNCDCALTNVEERDINKIKKEPKGVRGWLLFVIIIMMGLGPYLSFRQANYTVFEAELNNPQLSENTNWIKYKKACFTNLYICSTILFFGGLVLLFKRNWGAVTCAIIIIWLANPIASFVPTLFLPHYILGPSSVKYPLILGTFLGSSINASVWTIYLLKSKRVRNTYKKN